MQTPAGKECRHYYQDFHRGRNLQECRLIKSNPESMPWRPLDCSKCQVPSILNANASPLLELKLTVKSRFLGFGRSLEIEAFCEGKPVSLEDAYTGCDKRDLSHPGLDLFRKALEQSADTEDD